MNEIVLYFALKYKGQFDAIYQALKEKEPVDTVLQQELLARLKSRYVTILDDDYPERLKTMTCPPFVLFYYGDLSLANNHTISVIGMRNCSDYGRQVTQQLVGELVKEDLTIVSGMAIGIDGIAHETAMEQGGHTIAVLGGGIDCPYPKRHKYLYEAIKANHLVVSEYPFDNMPRRDGFPKRNRIIAGLGETVLVTEANLRSGTMITVGFALEYGKDIFAVPGRLDDAPGCNFLISQGAILVQDVSDIIERYCFHD
ncbi:MAG: DNA-processing protein DprA [Erysipelotrichaceae bacterium]|nr:DNA-processing protein DprA [Erysipelotrichaceae bacterium]